MKYLLVTMFALLFVPTQAQVKVEAKLDTAQILIGEQVQLQVIVTADKSRKIAFPEYAAQQQMTPGVEVISNGAIDTTQTADGKQVQLNRRYVVTSFDSAVYALRPSVVVNGDTVAARNEVKLRVNTVAVDTTNYDKFYGPHDVVNATFEWNALLLWPAVVLLLLLIAIIVLLVKLSDRKPKTKKVVIPPKVAPHKQALAYIENIKTLPRNDKETTKAYYMKLTDMLRNYIRERFGINALEMTSQEIVEALSQKGNAAALQELREVFETADLVKFAKHETSLSEADRNMLQAIDFVNQTKAEEQAHQKPTVKIVTIGEVKQRNLRRRMIALTTILCVVATALFVWLAYNIVEYFI